MMISTLQQVAMLVIDHNITGHYSLLYPLPLLQKNNNAVQFLLVQNY